MGFFKKPKRSDSARSDSDGGLSGQGATKATDVFRQALSEDWAPLLRDLGFKGSGRVFVLPDDRDWVMLGFQSSTASSASAVKFTINLLVVGKAEWQAARERAPYLSEKPSPNTLGGPNRYVQRIGFLTHGSDHWWWMRAGEDPRPLIEEVAGVLRNVATPKLRLEADDQSPGPRGAFENLGSKQD